LISQTYPRIEILLIDDGSTDESGKMCDYYAGKYDNISAFHKINGGLSDARNFGLHKSHGELISFVDSDDYVELDMIQFLYDLMKKNNVSLACARYDQVGEIVNGEVPYETGIEKLLTAKELLELMILIQNYKGLFASTSVWDRLYTRELIEGIVFPKGKNYEDIIFSTKVIIKAEKCAYANRVVYHYRVRSGSISNQANWDIRLFTDKFYFEKQQVELLMKYGMNELAELVKLRMKNDMIWQIVHYPNMECRKDALIATKKIKVSYLALLRSKLRIKNKLAILKNLALFVFVR
jgi:glycosyltransferase involved in cell wall biosynthesis